MSTNWYYEMGGGQHGPVSWETLQGVLGRGEIPSTNRVWTDGMQDWVAANQVPGLAFAPPAPPAYGTPAVVPSPGFHVPVSPHANPYAAPASVWAGGGMCAPQVGLDRFPPVARANYGLMASLIIGGFVLLCIGVAFLATSTSESGGLVILLGGLGISLWGWILGLIYLHRAWRMLQPHTTVTTPGAAVGLLFVPLFSLYWTFMAYWKWSQEWNRLVAYGSPGAPRMNEGLFLTYAIVTACSVVAGVFALVPACIIYLICMKQLCMAVNHAADHPA